MNLNRSILNNEPGATLRLPAPCVPAPGKRRFCAGKEDGLGLKQGRFFAETSPAHKKNIKNGCGAQRGTLYSP